MSRRSKTFILIVAALLVGVGYGLSRLHQPGSTKDGVGLIGNDAAHVIVRGERNQIQWRDGEVIHHWVGKLRAQPETVYFDRHEVRPATWANVFSRRGFLIRFLPNRVDVIDLENLKGEYYSPRTN